MTRTIGREVFLLIVEMAYEMDVADRIAQTVEKGLQRLTYDKEQKMIYRDNIESWEELKRMWHISYKNRAHYKKHDMSEDGDIPYHSVKRLPISVAGPYAVYLSLRKYAQGDTVATMICPIVEQNRQRVELDEYPVFNTLTVMTLDRAERLVSAYIHATRRKQFQDLFYYSASKDCTNAKVWNERLRLWRQKSLDVLF